MKNKSVIKCILVCAIIVCIVASTLGELCIWDVFSRLALAYISAFIFWFLTVNIPEKKKRAAQNQLIHDMFINLKCQIETIETTIGHDKDYILEDYEDFFLSNEKENHCSIVRFKCESIKKECQTILINNLSLNDDEIKHLLSIYNECYSIVDLTGLPIVGDQINIVSNALDNLFKEIQELDKLASKTIGGKI